ncbi:MAG: sigma-70 family RNA polymerase sigma factor [Clostridia bacterium]|nr:sigma-70 family RNA polymerase sigma factor [Clostridia bacterium]
MKENEKAELLFGLYEQEMYRVCFAILGDPYTAEDAVSESFLKLLKNRDRIVDPRADSCRRYVIKTAKNTAIDMYRKKAREREILEDLPENQVSVVPLTDDMSPIDTEDVLDRLSKKYRDVIVCMCINGLTVHETSAVLKISEACVRKRLERARHQLESIRKNV